MAGRSENDDHPIVTTEVPDTTPFNENISTLTDAIGSPEITRKELIQAEIGPPATPDQNSTLFTNESIIDDVYNSNGDLGPPRNDRDLGPPRNDQGM